MHYVDSAAKGEIDTHIKSSAYAITVEIFNYAKQEPKKAPVAIENIDDQSDGEMCIADDDSDFDGDGAADAVHKQPLEDL